jgi:flagellar motor switch protein FliM
VSGELLSNDQVAALVAAAHEGQLPERDNGGAGSRRRSRRVRTVDFTRPTKFTKDQVRRLELAHDTFCQTSSTRLSAELRVPMRLEVIDIGQLTWTNALAEVPSPSISAVIELEPHGTKMLMTVELSLILSIVERVLGGPVGRRIPSRKLSDIDRALAGHLFERLLDQLSVTWTDLAESTLRLRDLELQPETVQLAPLSEPTLCLSMEARMDRESSTMTLLIPYRAVDPVADRLGVDAYDDNEADADAGERMHRVMGAVDVQLRAEVAAMPLAAEDVLGIKPGDVLRFGQPADAGVTVFADETPVYRARPGRSGNRRAVQVLDRLGDDR